MAAFATHPQLSPTMTSKIHPYLTDRSHKAHIWELAWAPTSPLLASCSGDQTVRVWDSRNPDQPRILDQHRASVASLSWASDSQRLGAICRAGEVLIWDLHREESRRLVDLGLDRQAKSLTRIAWRPGSESIAVTPGNNRVLFVDVTSGDTIAEMNLGQQRIRCIAWSPSGSLLAAGTDEHRIYIWDGEAKHITAVLVGHFGSVLGLGWSPDDQTLASASEDETIRVWNTGSNRLQAILEGHTNAVYSAAFSPRCSLMGSRSLDGTIRLWRLGGWQSVAAIEETPYLAIDGLSFCATDPLLATKSVSDHAIRIWRLDEAALVEDELEAGSRQYVNARVALTGDTGVGKSGLALVLTGKEFRATESTHARRVWTLDSGEYEDGNCLETRETLLWDLAGQPGYRLIHQLYLHELAVAVVVFDSRSEADPFAGVRHWNTALTQAAQFITNGITPRKLLVSARNDRGGIAASRARVDRLVVELGFDGYYETSAKEGRGIGELRDAIRHCIDWSAQPRVSSNTLFQAIKQFLFQARESGNVLATDDELLQNFIASSHFEQGDWVDPPYAEFATCVRLVEARGLIRRLSFGDFVLLQPELLDAYASAMIDAARAEPDGFGSIREDHARTGDFFVPSDVRVSNPEAERLLCLATVESLTKYDLALRQESQLGTFLVFPSQFTRDWEESPEPAGEITRFQFTGPVSAVYATLAVRLAQSGRFRKREMWKNACTFVSDGKTGIFGIFLRSSDEGMGSLSIFAEQIETQEALSLLDLFQSFVATHLHRHAVPGSVEYHQVVNCKDCGERISATAVEARIARGLDWVTCPACDTRLQLHDTAPTRSRLLLEHVAVMDDAANAGRDRAVAVSVVEGKTYTRDFDVFLSYRSFHRQEVKNYERKLIERGILPWMDVSQIRPGTAWQSALESGIMRCKAAAVFIGRVPLSQEQRANIEDVKNRTKGLPGRKLIARMQEAFELENTALGPWQDVEVKAVLKTFVEQGLPVIPVILPDVKVEPQLPLFLQGMQVIDTRKKGVDHVEQLIWGVTGNQPSISVL